MGTESKTALCERRIPEKIAPIETAWFRLFHQAIIKSHELRIIVVFEDELAGPHLRLLPQQRFRAQVSLQFLECRPDVCVYVNLSRGARAPRSPRCQPLNLAHGP